MVKRKYLVLIFGLIFLLCGCSVDYDIKINKDLSVDESFTVVEEKEKIREKSYANTYEELLQSVKSNTGIDSSKYLINSYKNSSQLGAKVSRTYPSIQNYVNTVKDYDLFTTKTTYKKNGSVSTLTSKVIYKANEEFVAIAYFIDAKINIKVPFVVIENNADYVDEKNNIYSWDLKNYTNSTKPEDIMLVFDTDKKISSISDFLTYFIIVGVILIMFVFGFIIYKKANKTGEL